MKTIDKFLSYLYSLDIKLWVEGVSGAPLEEVRLRCDTPKGILTPELSAQISNRKAEIITFLEAANLASNITSQAIQPVLREGNLPLSSAQQRLWFLDQMEPGSPLYNVPGAVRLNGSLDVVAFERSFNEIVRRHESLRTTFEVVDAQPVQAIAPTFRLALPILDWRHLREDEREAEIQRLADEEAQQPFDLAKGPLLRLTLVHLDESEYVLLLTMHHIVSDAWSMGIFIQELSKLYEAFSTGQPSPLPELPIQYTDFAVWQKQWLSGEVPQNQLNYWRSQLQGAPELLQLPTDCPRPNIQTYRGTTQSFSLDSDLTQKLQTLSRESGTTLFMTLLAAFATLLYRYSGQEDILIGSPIANRNRWEIESLIGFFVNTLVLRTRFEDNPSMKDLLVRVRETTIKAYEHQDVPFEQLVQALQPQRSLSHSPLFQVMFVLQNAPMREVELLGVTLTQLERESTIAKFDLTLSITETDRGLVGEWEYNTDLFDRSTIERMAAHFQNLLSAIVENPQLPVAELPLLSEAERHQLLVEWNDTKSEYPSDKCIHHLFKEQVEKTPDAVAVVFENQQLTYQQLNQRANQLAHHLLSLGVKAEGLVGICVERSLKMVVGLLGILKAGGTYVPLDPSYPQERLSYILADSRVEVLLTQQSLLESLPEHQAKVVCLDTDWEAIEQHSQENLEAGVSSDNLAYVIYTSGSTGQPKGVQISHHSVVNFLNSMSYFPGLTQGDTFYAVTTISFDIAALELYLPLTVGAKVVVASHEIASNPDGLLSELSSSKITVMQATPATWQMLLTGGWSSNYPLKVLCGGEALSAQLAHQILETGSELWNLYGPTEATIWSTIYQVRANKAVTTTKDAFSAIGRPIANTQIYILDKHLQPLPIGVQGELYIGGDGLARGYLNRSELTQEKFIPNPFDNSNFNSQKSKLYKTGDLARYLPDGNIEYLGRLDHQVKIRGFRIELGEIESVLNTHPQIEQAIVIAIEDTTGNKRLVAYVVTSKKSLTSNQLREFLFSKLPEYMVPNAFITLDTLPLTPNGKVDRVALPVPNTTRPELEAAFVAPRTPTEQILAEIFAQVLEVEQVGVHDNFFELGGHSLLATQLIAQLLKMFEVEVTVVDLFKGPTVTDLAKRIEKMQTLEKLSRPSTKMADELEEIEI
ncbi:MAG: amino acid adenylation domain-containing protein [Symploca sp. SIO2E9]|nr:amino acid adenylation domain-containing protein [Symploca sp. SIO2E9]